jgi:pyruvate carboxylase
MSKQGIVPRNSSFFELNAHRDSANSKLGAAQMRLQKTDQILSDNESRLLKSPVQDFPIKRLMCCNRGEIAIRVFRCCKENGITSIGIYSEQDSMSLHRFKADEAYEVRAPNGSPVQAYLSMDEIIEIAIKNKVDAIHPGYGFLSENAKFAKKCKAAGIIFVGPNPETITQMGDKTAARRIARELGVPIIPGTDEPISSKEEAYEWCK